MKLKQLLIVFQKFTQNIDSRQQRLIEEKKDAKKIIFFLLVIITVTKFQ